MARHLPTELTFVSALKTIGVMSPASVATATHMSTASYLCGNIEGSITL